MNQAAEEVWDQIRIVWGHAHLPEHRSRARKPYKLIRRDNARTLEAGCPEDLWSQVASDWTRQQVPPQCHLKVTT